MKRLTEDLYLDKDSYQYILYRKGVITRGDNEGKDKMDEIAYLPTIAAVAREIRELAVGEWVNSELEECKKYVDEAYENLLKQL